MAQSFAHELNSGDRYTLDRAVDGADNWPPDITGRYSFYRRRGYDKSESMAYAIAWAANTLEQAGRRKRTA